MGAVCRLVPEQIAVGPGLTQEPEALPAPLPQGEGDGAVGPAFFDGLHQLAQEIVGKIPVLAPLQDESAEAQGVALLRA